MLNENLALWAGLEVVTLYDGAPRICVMRPTEHTGGAYELVPDYEHSLDLIARDLLPRLSEEQWREVCRQVRLRAPSGIGPLSVIRATLTLPPADLAAAIWEVVRA